MEWTGMFEAALVASFLMLVSGCLKGSEARGAIDWSVVLGIGAGLGIGEAMRVSQAAGRVANVLFEMTDAVFGLAGETIVAHPQVMLGLVAGLTLVLTNIITAKASAAPDRLAADC